MALDTTPEAAAFPHLFGPLEWLWRTLTYGRRQPFVRPSAPVAVPTMTA